MRPVLLRWSLVTIVALGLCWAAPIVDELEHSPGNLSLIVTTVHDRGAMLR